MPIPPLKPNKKRQSWRQNQRRLPSRARRPRQFKRPATLKTKATTSTRSTKTGRRKINLKIKKFIFIMGLSLILIGVLSVLSIVAWLSRDLPDPNRLIEREIPQSTEIYDRTGEIVLYEIHGNQKRILVDLEDVPNYLKQATISIEDKDFYHHKGFSFWAIFRTAITNILYGRRAGGSTLTQQLVKNAILTRKKTYTRKIKEILLAYKIEKKFSKDQIFQMYLNEIPYGSTAYGVEAASQTYFGKNVWEINIAEAAILAALPQAPSRYSPYGPNRQLLIDRQHYILDLMVKLGYITKEQAEEAKNYNLEFRPPTENIKAPHFVMYIKEMLAAKYGEKMIEQGGLKIYTTLDMYKQKIAEEVITEHEKDLEKWGASNAALVCLDPKTGEILAMVGSRDFFNEEIDGQVNITTRPRQPGSSLKPLVYATAFIKGYTPDTILYDVVTNFSHDSIEPYEPHNYDLKEHGPVTIRKALAGSLNIPAVKAIYLAGIDNVLDLAQELGYTTLRDRSRFGLSLVLGGGEVKLIEHANAYSAFAREGMINSLIGVLKVEDSQGKIIEEAKIKDKKVLDPGVAREINDILSDNAARAYAFGERNWLTLGKRPVAAKTGTTNDYRDAWTIGYTPSIVTGVWAGNNDNSPMKRGAAGGVVAAPIWHDFMDRILGDTPVEQFKKPEIKKTGKPILDGEIGPPQTVKIDQITGLLATEYTPPELIEERTYFKPHCILYYVNKDDPRGEHPSDPAKDPQFELWENAVQEWVKKNATSTKISGEPLPTEYDNVHKPENQPQIEVITPQSGQIITLPFLRVRLKATAPRGIAKAEYYLNNNLLFINRSYPFGLEKNINFLNNGFHNLKVKVCDDVLNCTTKEVEFNLSVADNHPKKQIKLSLVSPASGLAATNVDFPLAVVFSVSNPELVAKVEVYAAGNETEKTIAVFAPVDSSSLVAKWQSPPVSGTYQVWGKAFGWNGQDAESAKIILIITNTETVSATSTPG